MAFLEPSRPALFCKGIYPNGYPLLCRGLGPPDKNFASSINLFNKATIQESYKSLIINFNYKYTISFCKKKT